MNKAKVSKIMFWPSRTIGLPNYSSVTLNAGIEMTFPKPVDIDSKELKDAEEEAMKFVKEQYIKQYAPYQKIVVKKEES